MLKSYLGAVFWCTFLFVPPELHETGTIRKHWNRATIHAETKCVKEQLSEIRPLECELKIHNVMCNMETVQTVKIQTHNGSIHSYCRNKP